MRIIVSDSSALGILLAAQLARTKQEVVLLDTDKTRTKRFTADGLRIESSNGGWKSAIMSSTDPHSMKAPDIVFLCAKSYHTEEVLKRIKDILAPETYIVSLQNGLGNLQIINEYASSERVIGGVTYQEAIILGEGHVRIIAKGDTIIGQENGRVLGRIREIASLLTRAGFPTKITKDITSVIWSKLVISAGIDALSAVTRLRKEALVKNEYTREIMRRAVSEAVKVAKRKRVKLNYDDPIQKVEAVCKMSTEDIGTMLRDILEQRPTEIDYINGAIIRQAKSYNIKTPTNEMLTELIKPIEANYTHIVK